MSQSDWSLSADYEIDTFTLEEYNRVLEVVEPISSNGYEISSAVVKELSSQEIVDQNLSKVLCLGSTDLFYDPPYPESKIDHNIRESVAKALCESCVLIEPCLEIELKRPMNDQYGIRGGKTARQRKTIIKLRTESK